MCRIYIHVCVRITSTPSSSCLPLSSACLTLSLSCPTLSSSYLTLSPYTCIIRTCSVPVYTIYTTPWQCVCVCACAGVWLLLLREGRACGLCVYVCAPLLHLP